MSNVSRRQVLRLSSVGAVGLAGCTSVFETDSDPGSHENGAQPCDEYVYRSSESEPNGELPWHLSIRNISLSTYSISISISDHAGESPEEIVSCTATSDAHKQLVFELSPDTEYRVHVTLNRPDNPEEATTTISGWNRVTGPNEALRVSVENGEFEIRRVHYDTGKTPTDGNG